MRRGRLWSGRPTSLGIRLLRLLGLRGQGQQSPVHTLPPDLAVQGPRANCCPPSVAPSAGPVNQTTSVQGSGAGHPAPRCLPARPEAWGPGPGAQQTWPGSWLGPWLLCPLSMVQVARMVVGEEEARRAWLCRAPGE